MTIKTHFPSSHLSDFANIESILINYVGVDPKEVKVLSNNREGYGVMEYQVLECSESIKNEILNAGYSVEVLS